MNLQSLRYPLRGLLAIITGLIVYNIIVASYSYWILMLIVLLLQSTTGATFIRTAERIGGTLFGVLAGVLLIALLPYKPGIYYAGLILTLFGLVYFVTISYRTAMVFLGIFLIFLLSLFVGHGNQTQAIEFASIRFLDTIIAGLIVIVITYLCWPERTEVKLRQSFYQAIEATIKLIKQWQVPGQDINQNRIHIQEIYQAVTDFKTQANDAKFGWGDYVTKELSLESITHNLMGLYSCLVTINTYQLMNVSIPDLPKEDLTRELSDFIDTLLAQFMSIQQTQHWQNTQQEWQLTTVKFLQFAAAITEYERVHGRKQLLMETTDGVRFMMLIINLRQICVYLQFILAAVAQLRDK